jgi:hypothetical protein
MLRKATIEPEGGSAITVLFNPDKYSLKKSNEIAEAAIPGLEAPILQFVRGGSRTLSMELYFDTYEEQQSVSEHTDPVYKLLAINPDKHAPPKCTVRWGNFSFLCVLTEVSGEFSLFLADGTPVRAKLSVQFREWVDVKIMVSENPTRSADHRSVVYVKGGQTISLLAQQFYGDARKWRPIADENDLENPLVLEPGTMLRIPDIA